MIISVTVLLSLMYEQLSEKTIQFFNAFYTAYCLKHAASCFGVNDADNLQKVSIANSLNKKTDYDYLRASSIQQNYPNSHCQGE